jgi:hypothetical protein
MPLRKPDPVKSCEICGEPLFRKRFNGRLEDYNVFLKRRRCSQSCANARLIVNDDTYLWRARRHRKAGCETCGTSLRLHVHHKDRKRANNNPDNLQTLCSSCHLKLHWREDREKRLAAIPQKKERHCAICGAVHYKKGVQTCSAPCMRTLMSRRAYERYRGKAS